MPAGEEASALLSLARSRFPAAGASGLLAGVSRESTAVLFSNTRGDPCLGLPGADGLFGMCMDCAVHHS